MHVLGRLSLGAQCSLHRMQPIFVDLEIALLPFLRQQLGRSRLCSEHVNYNSNMRYNLLGFWGFGVAL
jgi:hypothetical protein